MKDTNVKGKPPMHSEIERKSVEIGFTMPSDLYIGSLLKTLISSKPRAIFLELGTGIGFSLSWMIDGMDSQSRLITVDNNANLCAIADQYFGGDPRVQIVCQDGSEWINNYKGDKFDLIFADAWPGKYSSIDAVLQLVKIGGFYVIDDMSAQTNWPEDHQSHVDRLVAYLDNREDFTLTKINWSTGLIMAVRKY